jgi:subtilisin family serine protease
MSIKPLIHTLLAGLLILTGCQGLPTTSFTEKSSAQTLSQTVQTSKGPYTGPLNLKINTGLIAGTSGKMIDLLPQGQGFQTQALPQGSIVFSETLNLSRKDQDFSRSFKIPDTSKRYLVHVSKQEPQRGREGRVQVNLNGAWVIREKDFERGEEEFQTTGLLLNANNALKIRFKGKVGSRLTVTVVETGEAGTILRRRGWEKDRDLTQADRIRNNDTNIFDPNDPDSLGGLEPYEGDEPTQNPSNPQRIGLALANQTQARIAVGEVRVLMREPVAANLQALQARFPVLVRETEESFGDTFATLQVKFEEVDLGELANHIQTLNQRPDILSLREVIFSSVNTAKTISAAFEIQAQAQDLVQGANLVTLGEKHSPVDFDEQNTPLTNETPTKTPPTVPVKASSLWWLESIKAREAWDYSLGEGATVAIIDGNFGKIQDYEEFKNRIVLNTGNSASYLRQGCAGIGTNPRTEPCISGDQDPHIPTPSEPYQNKLQSPPEHGLAVASILAASQDNTTGIVGMAPGAKILPMFSSGGIEINIPKQLERLYNENVSVDVVNISMGRSFNAFDLMLGANNYIDEYFQELLRAQGQVLPNYPPLPNVSNTDIRRLIRIIGKLSRERNVVFVTSGGNNGWEYNPGTATQSTELNFPSCLPFVIGVGAYEDAGGTLKRANFSTHQVKPAEKIFQPGSDYGPQLAIWAPGTNMWIQNHVFEPSLDNYKPTWKHWEGTSHATPLVAGTVALMKSINKNLTYGDIVLILQSRADALWDSSFIPAGMHPYAVYGLNAQGALQSPQVGGTTAKTYTFKVQNDGLEDIANKVPGNGRVATFRASNFAQLKALYPVLEVGQTIEMTGWTQSERSTIPANQIHVQKLQRVISAGGFQIQFENISTTPPPSPPPAVGVWITRDGQRKAVNPSQLIGIGITGLDLSGIEIVVDGQVMPIQQVASNYVSFGLTPNLAPGVKDMLIKLAGNTVTLPEAIEVLAMPPLQETQTLPTVGALQPAPFQINGEHFLAIPNYFNGQSYHLNSHIYKWNGTQFSLVQTIPTFGAYDLHPFSVGDQHFLAIANFDQNLYAANSEIYKWNGSQFVPFQTIPTTGGIDWESFNIDNRHFLALATHYNGSFERESLLYEWNGSQFVLFQNLPTRGAHKWTHFLTIGTERFLALTTYFYVGSGVEDSQSELYKWNGSQFVFNQTFATDFDLDFDAFTINGQLFAAIINNSRISNTVDSKILKWNGSQFVDFQNIPTTGGLNWDYFTVKGWHYLLLTTNTTLPQIYRWNGSQFELYRVLAMDKAWGSALLSAGPLENYLILGSLIGPQGYSSPSRVFRFD